MGLWKTSLPFYIPTSSSVNENAPNSWDHCNSFPHFQKAFQAPCRVHWLSLLNIELCKTDDGSCPLSSLQHITSNSTGQQEPLGFFCARAAILGFFLSSHEGRRSKCLQYLQGATKLQIGWKTSNLTPFSWCRMSVSGKSNELHYAQHMQNGDKYIREIATYQGRKTDELHSLALIHSPRIW